METLVPQVLPYIGSSALPLLIVVLFYIKIKNDRARTKSERDNDSQKIHDDVLRLQFEMTSMKGVTDLHRETLSDLQKQMQIVVKELVELNCSIKLILEERRKNDDGK